MCAALWIQQLRAGLPGGIAPGHLADAAADGQQSVKPDAAGLPARPTRALAYGRCESPFGTVHLAASVAGIAGVSLYDTEAGFRARLAPASWDASGADMLLAQAATELGEYFAGQRQVFTVPLDLAAGTAFDRRVLDAIAAIPYGETRTYGTLALAVGRPGAARAVGHACGRNPVPVLIACHRVVRAGSAIGGYSAGGTDVKARLLAIERGGRLL